MARSQHHLLGTALSVGALMISSGAMGADPDAALTLARQNGCLKCHAPEKAKDGPAYRDIAAKYQGKDHAASVKRLLEHINSGEKAKFPDGHEEEHKVIKTKDTAKQTNLVEWILSLPGGQWPPAK